MTGPEPTRGDVLLMGAMSAGIALLERSGATQFELAYDDEVPGPEPVLWNASASWRGARLFSRGYPYPHAAVEELMGKALNGGGCLRCGRTTVFGLVVAGDEYCCFQLVAADVDQDGTYRYVRTCEDPTLSAPPAPPLVVEGAVLSVAGDLYRVQDWRLPGVATDRVGKLYLRRVGSDG